MGHRIAQLVCTFFGVLVFALFFTSNPKAGELSLKITRDYWQVIAAFALVVGSVSYLKVNLVEISRGRERLYRIVGISGLIVMPVFAMIWGTRQSSPFIWMFENVQAPMQATVFALLAFFVASASLRGFRARSVQAGILLASAALILLSRTALEATSWSAMTAVSDWFRNYPSMAARRGILIGIGLGSLTTSLRVIVGIERTWLGRGR